MEEAIRNFATQFQWNPVIENADSLPQEYKNIVVSGMGGSHLATGLIKMWKPGINLYVHRDYDVPPFDDHFLKESLLIASSYSGNTEEVVSFLEEGVARGYKVAVIATGGLLIEKAKEFNLPFIQMPHTGIQPRNALGYALLSLAHFLKDDELITELVEIGGGKFEDCESDGKNLAENMHNKIPLIYSSLSNLSLAYNWKIKMNETAKIPAFYNVFPELNHNEMTGFDVVEGTHLLSKNMSFIFLKDRSDNERIQKRMDITETLLEERGFEVIVRELSGKTTFEKIVTTLLTADWTALHLSRMYGTEAEKVPMVEELKKIMRK